MTKTFIIAFLGGVLAIAKPTISFSVNYSKADSIAAIVPYSSSISIEKLAMLLTSGLQSDEEKVRSIYKWISLNIEYDVKLYLQMEKGRKLRQLENSHKAAYRALRKGEDVCSGYASLVKALCNSAGIECEVIEGYARNDHYVIGQSFESNHAWNAVMIGGKWKLLDATWGSGFVDLESAQYIPYFSENYFLADPEKFIHTHYPRDPFWDMIYKTPTLRQFYAAPQRENGFYLNKINQFYPATGIIRATVGDTINFRFTTNIEEEINKVTLQYLIRKENRQLKNDNITRFPVYKSFKTVDHPVKKSSHDYFFTETFSEQGAFKVYWIINGRATLRYDVYVK